MGYIVLGNIWFYCSSVPIFECLACIVIWILFRPCWSWLVYLYILHFSRKTCSRYTREGVIRNFYLDEVFDHRCVFNLSRSDIYTDINMNNTMFSVFLYIYLNNIYEIILRIQLFGRKCTNFWTAILWFLGSISVWIIGFHVGFLYIFDDLRATYSPLGETLKQYAGALHRPR